MAEAWREVGGGCDIPDPLPLPGRGAPRRQLFKKKELYGEGDDNEVRQKFMFKGKGGRYKNTSRRLFHSCLPFLQPNGFRPVFYNILKFAGVKNPNKHLPSRKLLGKMMIEMRDVSTLQVAIEVSKASEVTLYHDGTTLGQGTQSCNHHIASQLGIPAQREGEQARVLTLGSLPTASGEAADGAKAVMAQIAAVRRLVEMVEQGATEGDIAMSASMQIVASKINIAMLKSAMHDHQQGEDKLCDLLEQEILKWKKENVADFNKLTEKEQEDLSTIVRGYCFEHKIDNLGKAVVRGLSDFAKAGSFLPAKESGSRHTPPAGKTWLHACHKLIGRKHCKASGETTNLNADFKYHLEENHLEAAAKMIDSLGPLVGDRFWANFKTAALLYGLAPTIVDYLTKVRPVLQVKKGENQLNHSVRTMSTFSLDAKEVELIERNKARVLCEVRCMGIWHFALMVPALLMSARGMKKFSDQQPVIKAIHAFLTRVRDDEAFARTLMEEHDSPVSFVNPLGTSPFDGIGSANQWEAYKILCSPTANDALTLQMLQGTAAAMIKTNYDMSADLVLGGVQQDIKSMRANNISCERVFGFKDWRFHVAKMELGLRTDGIIMTRMNKTTEWVEQQIEELGEEEFDKWFDIIVSTAFTKATESEYKAHHREADKECMDRRRAKLKEDEAKQEEEMQLLTLVNEEEFDAGNVDASFWDLTQWISGQQTKKDKASVKAMALERIRRQWQRFKLIATSSKIPARQQAWPNQPSGVNLQVWLEAFKKMLNDTRLLGVLKKGRANLAKRGDVEVRPLGEVLSAIPAVKGLDEDEMRQFKQNCEDNSNKNHHRSKRHRDFELDNAPAQEEEEEDDMMEQDEEEADDVMMDV